MKLSTLKTEVRKYIAAAKAYDEKHPNDDRSETALGKLYEALSELGDEVCAAELGCDDDEFEF